MKPLVALLIISTNILSRLLPHLPNFSPEIVFTLYLSMKYEKLTTSIMIALSMTIVSDVLLSWVYIWSTFGAWTVFTYSALWVIVLMGRRLKTHHIGKSFYVITVIATLFYWGWTNAGTFLLSGLYPHSWNGFIACYTLALPFLANSFAGSMLWCTIMSACDHYLPSKIQQSVKYRL